jgi:catechol 2,3-dioxygenase-like lactoylglutathione lyase family enzyme
MINAAHVILYTRDADALRAFFRDVLELPHVDSGGGWLLFALPPAEVAMHPADDEPSQELYLMCDDIDATVARLKGRGVEFDGDITDEGWGRLTRIVLPDGGRLGLYQPHHPTAYRA